MTFIPFDVQQQQSPVGERIYFGADLIHADDDRCFRDGLPVRVPE